MGSREKLHTRRQFLRTSMLGAAATWTLPVFLEKTFFALEAMAADSPLQTATGKDHPILVVLQLAGGNDGLNTVVPYGDEDYYKARPTLGISPQKILKINDYLGLHPKLSGFKDLLDDGCMGIIQGVGYPNPNRSHFRSTEIWQTASDADKFKRYGWLGSYFDSCCKGEDPTVGVSIGDEMPQAFTAQEPTGVSFSRPEQYKRMDADLRSGKGSEEFFRELNLPERMEDVAADGGSIGAIAGTKFNEMNALDFLKRTALDAQVSSEKISAISRKYQSRISYPSTGLGANLNLIAKMIAGGLSSRVYYVSQGGYDTHTNQQGSHERLMQDLDTAVSAFCKDLKMQGNFNRVLLMTFSEFGRRVAQNGSSGTDHGAAAPMFVMGGQLKAGVFGKHPSLSNLDGGDLKFHTDFRSVYATVLEKWLKAPSGSVLGRKFEMLNFI